MSRYRQKCPFKIEPGDPAPLRCSLKHRVYFSETDALGIVWHGNYAAYFERAITELGHRIGIPVQGQEKVAGLPVRIPRIDIPGPKQFLAQGNVQQDIFFSLGHEERPELPMLFQQRRIVPDQQFIVRLVRSILPGEPDGLLEQLHGLVQFLAIGPAIPPECLRGLPTIRFNPLCCPFHGAQI